MKNSLLTILRDKNTNTPLFRKTSQKLIHILAQKTLDFVKEKKISVITPVSKVFGYTINQNIVLIPILRAGLAFLPTFLYYFEGAKVGFIGLKRDEKTFEAKEYYKNIPKIKPKDLILVLDPMLATGGSAISAVQSLIDSGAKQDQIIFACLLTAPEGFNSLRRKFPKIKIIFDTKDKKLNKEKFIVPGFGDFGDRYFGN